MASDGHSSVHEEKSEIHEELPEDSEASEDMNDGTAPDDPETPPTSSDESEVKKEWSGTGQHGRARQPETALFGGNKQHDRTNEAREDEIYGLDDDNDRCNESGGDRGIGGQCLKPLVGSFGAALGC